VPAPGSRHGWIARFLLAILLTASAAFLAFAGGTVLGGKYLVPPGQGLAAAPEAMGYGLLAALPAMVLAVIVSMKLEMKALLGTTFAALLGAIGLVGMLVVLAQGPDETSSSGPERPIMSTKPTSDGPVK